MGNSQLSKRHLKRKRMCSLLHALTFSCFDFRRFSFVCFHSLERIAFGFLRLLKLSTYWSSIYEERLREKSANLLRIFFFSFSLLSPFFFFGGWPTYLFSVARMLFGGIVWECEHEWIYNQQTERSACKSRERREKAKSYDSKSASSWVIFLWILYCGIMAMTIGYTSIMNMNSKHKICLCIFLYFYVEQCTVFMSQTAIQI